MSTSIPRHIIQTARSRDLRPAERAAARLLQLLHPEWTYSFFDDADVHRFIEEQFPQYRSVFEGFPYKIQRFDFFRYLAVYRLGGFYFDLDVFLSRPLDDLLDHASVFPFEEITLNRHLRKDLRIDWEIGNYAFGAAPGNEFLAQVIENCVRGQREPSWVSPMLDWAPRVFRGDLSVLVSTGPGLLTRTLVENPSTASGMRVLFPADVRDAQHWHLFGEHGVHLQAASWRPRRSLVFRKLALLWESRVRGKAEAESRKLGPTRPLPKGR